MSGNHGNEALKQSVVVFVAKHDLCHGAAQRRRCPARSKRREEAFCCCGSVTNNLLEQCADIFKSLIVAPSEHERSTFYKNVNIITRGVAKVAPVRDERFPWQRKCGVPVPNSDHATSRRMQTFQPPAGFRRVGSRSVSDYLRTTALRRGIAK